MKFIIKIFPLVFSLLLLACNKEDVSVVDSQSLKVEVQESVLFNTSKSASSHSCQYQLFGFADFPFQSNVINEIDYPFCTSQLCVLINDYSSNPYFSISSNELKICETGFESMSHQTECADFSPTQITFLQYDGGNEVHFFFSNDFWICFQDPVTYPGMDFQIEHSFPFT